jgi:hypothetical protein
MNKTTLISTLSFICVFSIIIISSCVKDVGKIPVTAVAVSACDTITYTKHIKPIIDSSCISCHGPTPLPGAPLLTNYAEVSANADKIRATALDPNPVPELMPQGGPPLPQAKKDLIQCWLTNGKKQ